MSDRAGDRPFWIQQIGYEQAEPALRAYYDKVRGPSGQLDNLYRAMSLRANTMGAADALYRAAMHAPDDNTIAPWLAELLGCLVAQRTRCNYALSHHGANFSALYPGPEPAEKVLQGLANREIPFALDAAHAAVVRYADLLVDEPERMTETDLNRLREVGWTDGEIVEIVQIVAMFSYFVRVINALGITTVGETIGYPMPDSPVASDDC